ncbi:hypothetical protein Syun_031257 [Stephania yunnanensis]|uniref:Uncharacterized protein n=1 Tax=Stephania yunnanensis TaxID=152371 RepID=A0AAP0DTY7_9MAGN
MAAATDQKRMHAGETLREPAGESKRQHSCLPPKNTSSRRYFTASFSVVPNLFLPKDRKTLIGYRPSLVHFAKLLEKFSFSGGILLWKKTS